MLKKLDALYLSAMATVKSFGRSLKEDERGLSGVVVAVLLILVAALAVVILWNVLKPWITDTFNKMTDAADGLS